MAKLVWDASGERLYETGISNGVLYPVNASGAYPQGVAWNGLIGIDENPSGAEATKLWADNINYITLYSAEEFGCTIKAYTYPEEFEQCDGSAEAATGAVIGQQPRKGFGLVYKTKIGSDTDPEAGYKLHLLYGCKVSPSAKSYATINDSPEAIEFSWEATCTPVNVTGYQATCTLVIDSTKVAAAKMALVEEQLFGRDADAQTSTEAITPNLPLPDAILAILNATNSTTTTPVVEGGE